MWLVVGRAVTSKRERERAEGGGGRSTALLFGKSVLLRLHQQQGEEWGASMMCLGRNPLRVIFLLVKMAFLLGVSKKWWNIFLKKRRRN